MNFTNLVFRKQVTVTRKIVALLMLSLLMFNMGGYFVLYYVLEVRAEGALAARIRVGDVSEQELVEFSVPFELPYPVLQQELEAQNRVSDDGVPITITKQEYRNYTLTVYGVRDQWAQHVDNVMEAFNQSANGESDTDDVTIHGLGNLLQAFENTSATGLIKYDSWVRMLLFGSPSEDISPVIIAVDPEPPRA